MVPRRKPMAMARRISLFEREVTVRLSPVGVDVLLAAGSVLSEGDFTGTGADARFAGSTMITIDLARTAASISDPVDASTARRVAELVPGDDHARERARRIAVAAAKRTAGCALDAPTVDVRARATGQSVQLDLDLEAQRRQ